jgi:DNA-binding SARP family transcriptional activator
VKQAAVVTLHIDVLGPPRATRDGVPVDGIRGGKAWALLLRLLRADAPVARRTVASLLFPDAADPAAALRWNLSQLRRHLGVGLDGDPIVLTLPPDTRVDLEVLAHGDAVEAAGVAARGGELLTGVTVDHAAWQAWLDAERRRATALAGDVLREAAVRHLSRGEAERAVALAERVVTLDPYDENAVVLLARSLRDAGRPADARAVVEAATTRLRDELGVDASPALRSVAHTSVGGTVGIGGRAAVEAQLEAGEAALAAGVPDAGIDALREALGGSRAIAEPDLLARSLTALGSALIHAVRGTDQDALALLHEAVPVAEAEGLDGLAARATRELGYVDLLRGRYDRAGRWFDQAARHATGDDQELAWIRAFAGAARTDVGDDTAADLLDDAVGRATAADAVRVTASALAWRGRLRLLADDVAGAATDLDGAAQIASAHGLRAFRPWPDAMRAELARRRGDLDGAQGLLDRALATGRQVGDPCWEAMALRGLGLVAVARGDLDVGVQRLEQAPRLCRRLPDTYLWIEVYGLEALADVASRHGLPGADGFVHRLAEASASHGMRPLLDRATTYRERLADAPSGPTASPAPTVSP